MKRLLLLIALISTSARAATFVVPDDRTLVESSKAIVAATAGASHSRWVPGGWIETVTTMYVGEAIKGPMAAGEAFEIHELGGVIDGVGYAVPGSPRYSEGERVLVFAEKNSRGAWVTKAMAVGAFAFVADRRGRELLVRDSAELYGWNSEGSTHRDPQRLAAPFLDYVRGMAHGRESTVDYVVHDPAGLTSKKNVSTLATPTIGSYLIQSGGVGIRWSTFPKPVVFLSHGQQPGALNGGLTSLQRGLGTWTNNPTSNIVYQYGGTTNAASTGLTGKGGPDGVNSVQFNDPADEITGAFTGSGVLAIGGAWFGSATHTFGGETFLTITEADLVVQDGIFGAGLTGNGFDHVLAHELGHTLGIRHSDKDPNDGPCGPPLSCTTNALMNSTVDFNNDPTGAALQAWDIEAVTAVYGSGTPVPPPCTPPAITSQPQSIDLPLNSDVVLSVSATGTLPLQYQWYIGSTGSTSAPVQGGTTPQISVRPATTTSYWVRVSSNCPPPADSSTATVTVNGCPAVLINSQSPSATILQGRSTTLTVSAVTGGALQYQWFIGTSGNTSSPVAGATGPSLDVKPLATASYWVSATNSCGAFANSDTYVVTVLPCNAPVILVQPISGQAAVGDSFTLSAILTGTQPITMQWYEGSAGDTSIPVPNAAAATVTILPVMSARTFWLRATNDCGEASSSAVVVTVVPSCIKPGITQQPRDVSVAQGAHALITVSATGTSLEYRWYQGQVFDFTKPLAGSLPTLYVAAVTAQTQYWVQITNSCGQVDSISATVSPVVPSRRRSAAH